MAYPQPAETLLIEGPDAMAFAHAQFSSSVNLLPTDQWQFSAWLDSQGRVRALFHLVRTGSERYLLLLRGGTAVEMVDALRRFLFRARVTLSALPPRHLSTGPALPLHAVTVDDSEVVLGCDDHSLKITPSASSDDAWRLLQLRAGWPWLPPSLLNNLLPAALSLQRLQAVAVDKGCYPGQEIVARLHFRGGHKRHLHRGTLSQAACAGDALRLDGRVVGHVLDSVNGNSGAEALLVLHDELIQASPSDAPVAVDGPLTIQLAASWPA